jgi:predicted nucleotidyltransferase
MPERPHDAPLEAALALVGRWVDEPLAVVLGGSHARGEAVWLELEGRRVCLSDLDLHAVVPDARARLRAEGRFAAPADLSALRAAGLDGPLELGVHTAAEWAALPARPATLELRRSGRVIQGDRAWIERLPDWRPSDVSREEVLLLLENRAFELIAARWPRGGGAAAEMRSAHAQYKVALDLAMVERLESGAFEADASSRVRAARETRRLAGIPPRPEPAWDSALGWLAGRVPAPAERAADWDRVAECWVRAWSERVAPGAETGDLERIARAAAGRARLRRRVRLALAPEIRRDCSPPLAARLAHLIAGTPQHRLDASAGALLSAVVLARSSRDPESAGRRLRGIVAELGAVAPGTFDEIAARLLETWERWVLSGTRSAAA